MRTEAAPPSAARAGLPAAVGSTARGGHFRALRRGVGDGNYDFRGANDCPTPILWVGLFPLLSRCDTAYGRGETSLVMPCGLGSGD